MHTPTPEKKKITIAQLSRIEALCDALEMRAASMFIAGNPPTPRWWLDRVGEILLGELASK